MERVVLLLRELNQRLDDMTQVEDEIRGVLFYRPKRHLCPIESLLLTGVGDDELTHLDPQRAQLVKAFTAENPEYNVVVFHTHTVGTIRNYGRGYATNFSERDIIIMEEQLRIYPDYIFMVATPQTKLLYAMDDPRLQIVESFPGYAMRSRAVHERLHQIAWEIGFDLDDVLK